MGMGGREGPVASCSCRLPLQKREKNLEKSLRHKIRKMLWSSFHVESIGIIHDGCQPCSSAPLEEVRCFRGIGLGAKINSPNASGTWKLGSAVRVGCQAE